MQKRIIKYIVLGVVAQTNNPSIQKVEAGTQGQPGLQETGSKKIK